MAIQGIIKISSFIINSFTFSISKLNAILEAPK